MKQFLKKLFAAEPPPAPSAAVATVATDDGLPLPPPALHSLITGRDDLDMSAFLEIGRGCASAVTGLLQRHGLAIENLEAVLDFGCGCGRIIRHFHRVPNVKMYGTDYNPTLVAWCKENLPFAEFGVNGLHPPLVYSDAKFDAIYAFSVFTHLPEDLQFAWLAELSRVMKPGGHLVMTTLGDAFARTSLSAGQKAQFESAQVVVVKPEIAGKNECLIFHPYDYIKRASADHFEVVEFVQGEAQVVSGQQMIAQDVYFLRKKA